MKIRKLAEKRKLDLRLRVVEVDTEIVHVKIFETRHRLTFNTEIYNCRKDLSVPKGGHLSEGLELAKKLFTIDGVQQVSFREYKIWVTISQAFNWDLDDISVRVIEVVKDYLRVQNVLEDVPGQGNLPAQE